MNPNDQALADKVDQALDALRRDPEQDPASWIATWAESCQISEVFQLLLTLRDLEQASLDWRAVRPEIEPETHSQYTEDFVGGGVSNQMPSAIGRYTVIRPLGAGGMGEVFLARDPQLGRLVAIKMPQLGKIAASSKMIARFLREARSAATVTHPNICPIYDVGEDQGRPYVVMAYIEGDSLETYLRKNGRCADPGEAVKLVRQIVGALAAVHQHGMVHRDLKPANILLDRDGKAILTDFGLARAIEGHEQLSSDGAILGTPAYMAPEQAAGDSSRIGPATDLYAVGVVLYRMLTGRIPFEGQLMTIMGKLANEQPTPPSKHRPDLPPALERIILRLLAKSPTARYPDARTLDADLAAFTVGTASPRRWLPAALLTWSIVAGCLIALTLTVAWLMRTPPRTVTEPTQPRAIAPAATEVVADVGQPSKYLTLELELSVWNQSPGVRTEGLLGKPGSVPVRIGELLRIRAEVSEPSYLYLLWVNTQGQLDPLYPWNPHFGLQAPPGLVFPGQAAAAVATDLARFYLGPAYRTDRLTRQFVSPISLSDGWEISGPEGDHLFFLLARRTPLPDSVDIRQLIGDVEIAQRSPNSQLEWFCIENERLYQANPLVKRTRAPRIKQLQDPLIRLLTKLHPTFEAAHGVRVACKR